MNPKTHGQGSSRSGDLIYEAIKVGELPGMGESVTFAKAPGRLPASHSEYSGFGFLLREPRRVLTLSSKVVDGG